MTHPERPIVTGPIDWLTVRFRSARDSWSTLLALTMFVGGMLLLAMGLERWRVVFFIRDTGASRSPAPYRMQFTQWRAPVHAARLSNHWYVAVSRLDDAPAACAAAAQAGGMAAGKPLAVLAVDEERTLGVTSCTAVSPASHGNIPLLSLSYIALSNNARLVLRGGIGLLDDSLSVRYASHDPGALVRLPEIVGLYAGQVRMVRESP